MLVYRRYVGMKKKIVTVTMLTAICVMCACGNANVQRTSSAPGNLTISDLMASADASMQEEKQEEPAQETPDVVSVTSVEEETEAPLESTPEDSDVDIDLTKLSKTMVYSEVYNIMLNPDDYVGKTMRMGGEYYIFTDEATGNRYFYCVIQDATACCAQGIEFILTDDYRYPDDYPEEGTYLTVSGRFDTYMEGEYLYCTLRDAVLEN